MTINQPAKHLIDGYLPTIGIECHVQLQTETKLFTAIKNKNSNQTANSAVGPLCLGLPGALPVVNQQAINLAIRAGLALGCQIASQTSFDRKHYFYPDLPLGYQISQHHEPIIQSGQITVASSQQDSFQVGIDHAHLEADAGKLTHQADWDFSLLDLNRVGTPLLEIVSLPDIHSAAQAKLYARELYLRMVYAQVCAGDLSAGNLRFDVNVSVSKDDNLGIRTEIKNLNSFRFLEQAVNYEITRQIDLLKKNKKVIQETRGWNENAKQTFSQRSKEDAQDYRYMPDPDIPPVIIQQSEIDAIQQSLGVQPQIVRDLLKSWQVSYDNTEIIIDYPQLAQFIYQLKGQLQAAEARLIVNWLIGELLSLLNKKEIKLTEILNSGSRLQTLAQLVLEDKISATAAKSYLIKICRDQFNPQIITDDSSNLQISDEAALQKLVQQVIKQHPQACQDARKDPKAIGFLIGQTMKLSQGKANPQVLNKLIKDLLTS